ncbi:hypothetical protein IAE60_00345 [Pseudoxanthomonas mexicana]|jgi:hypothetical protein|uniref:Uncharacterized protein n=1 Tax=Pseudoxanthomonas mexicana TaxID=128785 RepID=A0A7G9TCV7_PSEMX|nr:MULTISPECIES: hypothetical protein [Pseudoxanthomonas]MCH2093320.1 hypothetical protein [Pseudoxanthomonas sp.]QNN77932.1 hypothetical protein IAE60_00345 [Pseudoxanthomonas mexicana]
MRPAPEIVGFEFDWLAIDKEGRLALFSTAGSGMAPKSAIDARESLDAVLSLIETPNWGTVHVWDDYASVGLYVYDWDLSSGVYRRLRVPAGSANRAPLASLKIVGGVPRVDCDFAFQDDIRPEILR